MKQIPGGVTAPKGFRAWGVHCGVKSKKADKKDLTLILSDQECAAAAVYTMNRVKAAPLDVTMEHLEDGTASGVAANSGTANASCPQHRRHSGADAGGGGGPHRRAGRLRRGGPRHHDHRHGEEGACPRLLYRRQDRDTRRHRQGLRHDPPQHGHHAVLRHHRLRHHPGDALRGPPRGGPPHLQPGDGGRGHLHQRHVRGAGQRYGGQSPHRVEG